MSQVRHFNHFAGTYTVRPHSSVPSLHPRTEYTRCQSRGRILDSGIPKAWLATDQGCFKVTWKFNHYNVARSDTTGGSDLAGDNSGFAGVRAWWLRAQGCRTFHADTSENCGLALSPRARIRAAD